MTSPPPFLPSSLFLPLQARTALLPASPTASMVARPAMGQGCKAFCRPSITPTMSTLCILAWQPTSLSADCSSTTLTATPSSQLSETSRCTLSLTLLWKTAWPRSNNAIIPAILLQDIEWDWLVNLDAYDCALIKPDGKQLLSSSFPSIYLESQYLTWFKFHCICSSLTSLD